ncbi:MAG: alpha/beta hydrolase [Parvibaculaceae bacterium]
MAVTPGPIPRPMADVEGPPLSNSLREFLTPVELARLLLLWWTLPFNLRGKGHNVLLLPGLGGGERSMFVIKEYLRALGYVVHDWGLGRNDGKVVEKMPLVAAEVAKRAAEAAEPIALVGWSLGGYFAREAARDNPAAVSRVITLGSPVVGGPKYTATSRFFERRNVDRDAIEARVSERYKVPITVPVTSIYSKGDGIVAWQASVDHWSPKAENIEVATTHFGFGFSKEVLTLIAERLAGVKGPSAEK